MGIFSGLSNLVEFRADTGNALSDFWYQPVGGKSVSGVSISADAVMRISAAWACVRVISETMAYAPLFLYERMPDDTREKAKGFYLYNILHDQPNKYQTAYEFKEMLTAHALLRGNGYAEIVPGRRGFADQLIPLHPDRVSIEQYQNGVWHSDNILENAPVRYKVRRRNGTEDTLSDSQVFHLRGLSNGGLKGMAVIEYARDSFGLAIAAESYGARFFNQDARPGGVIRHPKTLTGTAKDYLKAQWNQAHSGLSNAHAVAVLDEGMEWETVGMSNEDAQFLAVRSFQVADIARWFRVPLHMIQETEKSTTWGSGIEQLSLAFILYTMLPWAGRWEQAISRDLINSSDRYYAEYNFDALLRGDLKSRYEAYQAAAGGNAPFMSRNEIRRKENMNPISGLDDMLKPLNMGGINDSPQSVKKLGQSNANSVYLKDAAARVVRKESTVLGKAAKRCASDSEAWNQAVREFYDSHAQYVIENMHISQGKAEAYIYAQCRDIERRGVAFLETGESESIERLVSLVDFDIEDAA